MSFFTSLDVGISGLNAQATQLDSISSNIANIDTTGFKAGRVNFADLIADSQTSNYSPGGVQSSLQDLVDIQGTINPSSISTDIAVSGQGLFPVTATADGSSGLLYTRAGSFAQDTGGFLVNGAGFFLEAWPLDANGNLPSSLTTSSLQPVNLSSLSETAVPTSTVTVQANLDASQTANAAPYDPTNPAENMASGAVTPQFSTAINTMVDSNGVSHNLTVGFLKTGTNTWAAEVYADPSTDVTATPAGQVAAGTITFNSDGTLGSISPALQNISVNWASGATNTLAVNWGTAGPIFGTPGATVVGKADGLSQFSGSYTTNVQANGHTVGNLTSVTIDQNGYIVGNFSNNTSQNFYKIPLAQFLNPDGLQNLSGTVYNQTLSSGAPTLVQAGQDNGPKIVPNSLESSTADEPTQLSDLIIAQRAYDANSKTISVTDTMMQDLDTMGTT